MSVMAHRAGLPGLHGTSRLSEPPLGEEKKNESKWSR